MPLPWIPAAIFFILSPIISSFAQFQSAQNIQTFHPYRPPLLLQPSSPQDSSPPVRRSSSSPRIAVAVGATAAGALVFAGLLIALSWGRLPRRRRRTPIAAAARNLHVSPPSDGELVASKVEDDGLDLIYWRRLQGRDARNSSRKIDVKEGGSDHVQENHMIQKKKSSIGRNRVSPMFDVQDLGENPPLDPPPPPPAPRPPPPPGAIRKGFVPPPPPPVPQRNREVSSAVVSRADHNAINMKMKPLHWEKLDKKSSKSMAWDGMNDGSFSFDGDLMEALFGSVAAGKRSDHTTSKHLKDTEPNPSSSPIFILDPKKSQNTAIVIRSIPESREEIIACITDGENHNLHIDTLEKLVRIAPTKEEQSRILAFEGTTSNLADAEFFLYSLLKSVPSSFTRLTALYFTSTYRTDMDQHIELLRTLSSACTELRSRGFFPKLLEAVLKAGNRMNAGTVRGNASAFDLTSLRKLADVRSTDGSTTLLHFVVEEVVLAEGKRCALNTDHNSGNNDLLHDSTVEKQRYIMLGMPLVGGACSEFYNVKKAAAMDYNSIAGIISGMKKKTCEMRKIVEECDGCGGFQSQLERFLDRAEEEMKSVEEEEDMVMEMVKNTMEYYQSKAAVKGRENPLYIFVVVRDFLNMVDQACVDITRKQQIEKKKMKRKKKELESSNCSSSSSSSSLASYSSSSPSPMAGSPFDNWFLNLPSDETDA